jgi:hypothetical protein
MAEDWSLVRGLVRDWKPTDVGIAEHEAKPDPHPQYTKEVDALAAFALAAYAGMSYRGPDFGPSALGAAWDDLDFLNTLSVTTPRGITPDLVSSTMAVNLPGVYFLSITFSMSHNDVPQARSTMLRLFDETDGIAVGEGLRIGTGRNAASTNGSVSTLFDISAAGVGHAIGVQMGNGSTYSDVFYTAFSYTLHSVGEYRGTLGAAATGVGIQGKGRGSGDRPPG